LKVFSTAYYILLVAFIDRPVHHFRKTIQEPHEIPHIFLSQPFNNARHQIVHVLLSLINGGLSLFRQGDDYFPAVITVYRTPDLPAFFKAAQYLAYRRF
jgi:hypothetical protein